MPRASPIDPENLIADIGLGPQARVGVACSGGLDSVLLLVAAASVARRQQWSVITIHVQHALRGLESDGDEAFVRALAARLDVPCVIARLAWDTGTPGSLEERARAGRYTAFRRIARRRHLTHVLLAHHEDDQVESVLMRLLRGSGPRGLRGMPASRPLTGTCTVVRPFLAVSRAALAQAAITRGLAWREDSSNLDLRFTRNRVRHVVLPRLLHVLPDARARLLRLAARAAAAWAALENAARPLRDAVVRVRLPGLLGVAIPPLQGLPPDLVHHLLRDLVDDPADSTRTALGRRAFANLLPLLAPDRTAGATTLPSGLRVRRERDTLWLGRRTAAPPPTTPLALPGVVLWAPLGGRLRLTPVHGRARIAAALTGARRDGLRGVLDLDAVVGQLSVRTRRPGDAYRPLGAPGTRRLKRLLLDQRVPLALRPRLPVLTDDRGLLWIPGLPPAHRVRVTQKTQRAVALAWSGLDPRAGASGR